MSLIDPSWLERRTPHQRLEIVAVALIVVLLAIGIIFWAYSGDDPEKERKDAVNIGIDQGKNAVQSNLVVNREREVNNAENNANLATNDLNNSISKPSNQFDGNRANDRYCRDFPKECK